MRLFETEVNQHVHFAFDYLLSWSIIVCVCVLFLWGGEGGWSKELHELGDQYIIERTSNAVDSNVQLYKGQNEYATGVGE